MRNEGPVLGVCCGKVEGHASLQNLQATHVTDTHTKWAAKKNSSILLEYANFQSVEQTSCVCTAVWDPVNACMCVDKWISWSESHLKTEAGQCLIKDLNSDLIF